MKGKIINGKGYNIKGDESFEIKNGKGYIKEYAYNGILLFEGEYDYEGNLTFEGEYLNGEIWKGIKKLYSAGRKLIAEEEYSKGKKNSKYKQYSYKDKLFYDDGESDSEYVCYTSGEDELLILEDEYLYNEKNGIWKEYNYNGILIFEGGYLNGKRNGKGKEYDYNGILIFEGKYLKGERWNGKLYEYKNGTNHLIYEYKNGEKITKNN